MKTPIYLLEKITGIKDENGVELCYAFGARLTREAAETDFADDIATNKVRVRKIIATKP
jgi:biotin synthase-like enzyme